MSTSETYLSMSDEDLMKSYLSGDEKAFEVVYGRRRAGLRRFFEQHCGSRATAQELAQDVWFKLIRACQNKQYTAEAKFTTYIYRLAKNQLIDWYRKNGNVKTVELYEDSDSDDEAIEHRNYHVDDPESLYANRESLAAVMKAVESLSKEQQTTLLMQLEGNMSYDEIAEAMGTNRETVKSRLRYAREHLKRRVFGGATV